MNKIQLQDIDNNVTITDFDHKFHYCRVKDPDNDKNIINYFNVFYKNKIKNEQGKIIDGDWNAVTSGLLSNKFSVVKSEDLLQEIEKSLSSKSENINVEFNATTSIVKFMLTDWADNFVDDDLADKLMFRLISEVNVDRTNYNTRLGFILVNGYSGMRSVSLKYSLDYVLKDKKDVIVFHNPYIFSGVDTQLIHNQNFFINKDEMVLIKDKLILCMNKFKNTELNDDILEEFVKILSSKQKDLFKSVIQPLYDADNKYKNVYYLSYIISAVPEFNKSITQQTRFQNIFQTILKQK